MGERNISCSVCNCALGVIRDAKLRKDITYTCGKCVADYDTELKNLKLKLRTMKAFGELSGKQPSAFDDIFSGVFGDKY